MAHTCGRLFGWLLPAFCGAGLLLAVDAAAAATVAVIYPEVAAPYQRVFDSIIDGAREVPGSKVVSRALGDDESADAVEQWLREQQVDAVVALGQRGYKYAVALPPSFPVVVGAALVTPDGVSGISLAADPEQFFRRLGELTPPVKRVFVVYSEKNSGWLVRRAERLASHYRIQLVTLEADDMRGAVKGYAEMLDRAQDAQDAIWLPLDTIAPDKAVLPLVLEAAWKKHLVVFSNNPSHAEKGVLFSLFPDNEALGTRLAEMALDLMRRTDRSPTVVPLNDIKIAVNLRTASHLGMVYTPNQQREFALVFPSR